MVVTFITEGGLSLSRCHTAYWPTDNLFLSRLSKELGAKRFNIA